MGATEVFHSFTTEILTNICHQNCLCGNLTQSSSVSFHRARYMQ
jgi:hypothetical protein